MGIANLTSCYLVGCTILICEPVPLQSCSFSMCTRGCCKAGPRPSCRSWSTASRCQVLPLNLLSTRVLKQELVRYGDLTLELSRAGLRLPAGQAAPCIQRPEERPGQNAELPDLPGPLTQRQLRQGAPGQQPFPWTQPIPWHYLQPLAECEACGCRRPWRQPWLARCRHVRTKPTCARSCS